MDHRIIIFQPIKKTLTTFSSLKDTIAEQESKGLSSEKIKPPSAKNHSLPSKLVWINNLRIRLEFKAGYLKQDKVSFTPNSVVNLIIVYELNTWSRYLPDDFTVKYCLFGAVNTTKNADPDKYSYSGHGCVFLSCHVLVSE